VTWHGASSAARSPSTQSPPLERSIALSKIVAIMSMSLDGYVADRGDGVAEVFDWYFTSGDVDFHALLGSGVRLFDHLAGTPAVLGHPTVIAGVGVTHLRSPVRRT
jgi:hypothetical protein